ncbi:TonB-dependent receptor [Chryseobacterium indologenes]|uniref:TonB-dependent receptor domain-containing protein n=1 Tax=Chryseobacterium indologenes TaxID=253 RepID=UPI000BFD12F8|nr:TonB-dependent receptor [Chryseobacterium indologenes]ATN06218.1 TonB-dependent receptor [Chryseobacterium indologenes]AYY85021.1 TonB-dependent receptor [Chryseobacterium indologenes]QIX81903.1 TonB-dependent receptor [Chryseobacterium indologenes]UDQ55676.1 TonB-dependent receptor [Chryseobacterium indologenes]
MKKTIGIALMVLPVLAFSQSITGKILHDGNIAPYVEVVVTKDQKNQTTISDEKGSYSLKLSENGNYILKLIRDGEEVSRRDISVQGDVKQDFFLEKKVEKQIEGVTLTARKKLIERKADRLVFNVANSVASQGMDGADAMATTPLVKVDDNSGVSIAGKSGVAIMINERILNLSGAELVTYLKSLRSENIEKIEVITTPPAKYEVQGNSGLINIVLKKNQNLGWSGSITTTLQQQTYTGTSNSATINYQNEKMRSSLKLRQNKSEKHSYENYRIEGAEGLRSSDSRRDFGDGAGANFSLDYQLNSKSNAGFIYDYGFGHSNMDIINTSDYFRNENYTNTLLTSAEHRAKTTQQTISAYYDIKFGKQEHKLSITGNYFSNNPETTIDFVTRENSGQGSIVKSPSTVDYKIYSGQADLTLPFQLAKTEAGVKFTNFDNNSQISYQNFIDGKYVTDPVKSNEFKYQEKNYAAYISFEKSFNEKWSAKTGLRYEYSTITGYSLISGQQTENSYGKFFPTAYISYKSNENHTFNLSYSKRINRPGFRAINPYRWYTNINSYFTGNPFLQPSINHNFEFSHVYKGKLSTSFYFQRSLDAFGQLTNLKDENKISTFENYYNQNSLGLTINYSDTFFRLWELNYAADLSYMETNVFATDAASRKGSGYEFNFQNNISLNKSKTIQLIANYWMRLPSNSGNIRWEYLGNFTTGIKISLMEKNLQINATVSDIFKQAKSLGQIFYTSGTHSFNNYYDARRLTVSATYTFGNKKVKGADRNVKFDEKNRAN